MMTTIANTSNKIVPIKYHKSIKTSSIKQDSITDRSINKSRYLCDNLPTYTGCFIEMIDRTQDSLYFA